MKYCSETTKEKHVESGGSKDGRGEAVDSLPGIFLSKRMILSHWSKQGIAFFKWTLLLAMAMLRKALVASFIKPATGKDKAPEMKNTENR